MLAASSHQEKNGQSCPSPTHTTTPHNHTRAYDPHHAPLHRHAVVVLVVVVLACIASARPRLRASSIQQTRLAFEIPNTITKRCPSPCPVFRHPPTHQHTNTGPGSPLPAFSCGDEPWAHAHRLLPCGLNMQNYSSFLPDQRVRPTTRRAGGRGAGCRSIRPIWIHKQSRINQRPHAVVRLLR